MTELDHRSVLLALKSALLATDVIRDREELVVLSRVGRRRSTLYFVGVAGQPGSSRWVVKQPNTPVQQPDLGSPLTAQDQYDALLRAHDVLERHDGPFSTPRPVAHLADVGAFAMEFVAGTSIPLLLQSRAVWNRRPLFDAVSWAAALLRVVHGTEPDAGLGVAQERTTSEALGEGQRVLQRVGLPYRPSWFDRTAQSPQQAQASVLLHGDFAPENVVISSGRVYCLDPELVARGPREVDVVRFLTMLCDAPPFVAALGAGPFGRLRRRMASDFVRAYYGATGPPDNLQPMLVHSLARRWAQRHEHVIQRGASVAAARTALLRAYFSRLLSEVSSAGQWP